jgi:hemerythrin-like metal-binding protein
VDNPETDPKQWPFLVREGLKYMEGYFETHFRREEAYMRKINYSHYEAHKVVHDELEQTVQQYIDTRLGGETCELDDVLKLLGANYGWMMIHIAMDDMAIVGKGALALPEETELNGENVTREMDAMLGSLLDFNAKTKIVDSEFKGEGLNSAVCQKITYNVAGTDVTLVFGLERSFLRYATETFWGRKLQKQTIDKAHTMLLQWCLTAFSVSLWRELIVRFTHDKSCLLKDTSPLDVKDARQMVRTVTPRQSTLYETTKGRFFVISDHYVANRGSYQTRPMERKNDSK